MNFPRDLSFSSPEEVSSFEDRLTDYQTSCGAPPFQWVSLRDEWSLSREQEGGGRVFAALVDLRLAVGALEIDLREITRELAAEPPSLHSRLRLYRINSAYILRMRSILDKIMGFMVLSARPGEYDSFRRAKSRKRAFMKLAAQGSEIPVPIAQYIEKFVEQFDTKYRTPEAHGSGSVRTWVFGEIGGADSNQADMFWSWNTLYPLLTLISKRRTPRALAGS
jgi:hypothetical protein